MFLWESEMEENEDLWVFWVAQESRVKRRWHGLKVETIKVEFGGLWEGWFGLYIYMGCKLGSFVSDLFKRNVIFFISPAFHLYSFFFSNLLLKIQFEKKLKNKTFLIKFFWAFSRNKNSIFYFKLTLSFNNNLKHIM